MAIIIAEPILRAATKASSYRWVICGLLFAATVINYVDRQMIGVLKPTLQAEFGWAETDYATIIFWFQAAYAVGYIGFGRFVDVIGALTGYAVAGGAYLLALLLIHILSPRLERTSGRLSSVEPTS